MLPSASPLLRRGFSRSDAIVLVLVIGRVDVIPGHDGPPGVGRVPGSRDAAATSPRSASHSCSYDRMTRPSARDGDDATGSASERGPGRPAQDSCSSPSTYPTSPSCAIHRSDRRAGTARCRARCRSRGSSAPATPTPLQDDSRHPSAIAPPPATRTGATTARSQPVARGASRRSRPAMAWAIRRHSASGWLATGGAGHETLSSYRIVPPPLSDAGCPSAPDEGGLRGDAGSSWIAADYRSTLYNHALTPNGRPSCIADDGRTAYMGASSGHVRGVNVLRLDGSVSLVVPTIAARDLVARPGWDLGTSASRRPFERPGPVSSFLVSRMKLGYREYSDARTGLDL